MPAAVSQPLSLSARPAKTGRARGRTRRTTWRRRFACATEADPFNFNTEPCICDNGKGGVGERPERAPD
eukprot:4812233-Prymnesium_polylepis.1